MSFLSIIKDSNSIYFVQLGNTTKISLAALITLLAGLILAIAVVSMLPNSYNMAMLIVIGSIIAAYEVNCTQVGQCNIWAWSLTTLYFIYVSILVYFIYKNRHNPMELASDINNTIHMLNSRMRNFMTKKVTN
jgi:hypothetical protein